ncbi:MAG: DUF2079 domain-containing protein [Ruminococcaceae bacterium]|nr:DUF2079 domain-containing protein [Oscillospiraceae bacterium]
MKLLKKFYPLNMGDAIRRVLLAWMLAATVEFFLLPSALRSLDGVLGLAEMSLVRVVLLTAAGGALLQAFRLDAKLERWLTVGVFALFAASCLIASFSWGFLAVCMIVLAILVVYAVFGAAPECAPKIAPKGKKRWHVVTFIMAAVFFAFVSAWTVCRLYSFVNSTYDFGIFAQMFHSMKSAGAPMTTLERSKMLSHFHVHMSPIYYLMLPFYWLFPSPATLQILQAAILASAVIPLWKLGRLHGLGEPIRVLLCAVLLVFPAFSGGVSYDLHENCFLTPLILWLFYAIDAKNIKLTAVFALLTLMVKEDAAVYVAVIALWLFLAKKEQRYTALALLVGSLIWFFAVTAYLQNVGDGVMSYRYENYMYDGSSSLMTVIKAVILCPMKALFEAFEPQKLNFILQTMLPLAFLPLITRKYSRFLLLIPYFLVNLMSDYTYQHSIFFQYCYGPLACLMYLTVVNAADLPKKSLQVIPLCAALILGMGFFHETVLPVAERSIERYEKNQAHYDEIRTALEVVPEGASVTATAFYTPHLAQREILYDVLHCTSEQLFSTDYVVLQINARNEYASYNSSPDIYDGYENLTKLLEARGYTLFYELEDVFTIYQR